MSWTWIAEDWGLILRAIITAIVLLIIIIVIVKINGLRSFAKINSIDFAVTITIGSVLSSTIINDQNSLLKGAIVVCVLLAIQTIIGKLKTHFKWFEEKAFNQPIFLMKDGEFLDDNIDSLKINRQNIVAKLRANNVKNIKDVRAVILETTGDINVISGETEIDDYILSDVRMSPKDNNITLQKTYK